MCVCKSGRCKGQLFYSGKTKWRFRKKGFFDEKRRKVKVIITTPV